MFVWKSTYDDLKAKYNTSIDEGMESSRKLRKANSDLQANQALLKDERNKRADVGAQIDKALKDIDRLKLNIKNYNDELVKAKKHLGDALKHSAKLGKDKKSLFARAGGYAKSYANVQQRIVDAKSLKELKAYVKASRHRAELKNIRDEAKAKK